MIAQNKQVVPPLPNDGTLGNFSSVIQKNLLDLHQAAHIHKIVTTDPSINDGNIGDIYIVQTALKTYLTVKTSDGWKAQTNGEVRVADFGAYGDGIHDDSIAIQKAANAIISLKQSTILVFDSLTYLCNSGLLFNMGFLSLQGNCAKLDFHNLTSGTAITLVGSSASDFEGNPFLQADKEISQFTIAGNNFGGSVTGILFTTGEGTGTGASHITIRSCDIHEFHTGLLYGDGSYLIKVVDTDIWHCIIDISMPGSNDAGENNSFYGCAFYNSGSGLIMDNVIGDCSFYSCSFDGMDSNYISVTSGICNLYSPHLEGNFGTGEPTNPKFITNPAGIGSRSSISIFEPTFIIKQAQAGDNLAVPIIGIYGTTSFHMYGGSAILSGGTFVAPATGAIEAPTGVSDILVLNFEWIATAGLYGTFNSSVTTTLNAYNSNDFSTTKQITAKQFGVASNIMTWGTAAPVSGTYQQGDIVWNKGAISGGFGGFICVSAGTPGTWKTFSPIS